jgi:hypothetical protein
VRAGPLSSTRRTPPPRRRTQRTSNGHIGGGGEASAGSMTGGSPRTAEAGVGGVQFSRRMSVEDVCAWVRGTEMGEPAVFILESLHID